MTDSSWRYQIPFRNKEITVSFDGGYISSDGGLLLLQQLDKRLGVTERLAGCIYDKRDPNLVDQPVLTLVRQRILGLVLGYEDCNDFDTLRKDPMFKLAVGREPETGKDLGSQPTLSRLENSVGAKDLIRLSRELVDLFVERHQAVPPRRIILDVDATDDPAHGQQELEFYHGYYNQHCYLPLLMYATAEGEDNTSGQQELIAAVLRPGNIHAGHRMVAVLRRVVKRLRKAFPGGKILLRGDGGFACPEVYAYCESARLDYVISLPKNSRLLKLAEPFLAEARTMYEETGEKVRRFAEFQYAADSWPHERRVILKAEVLPKGDNPRFTVTNLAGEAEEMYECYTRRGDVENRIKELKEDLKSGRTSCHRFLANQFRLILHAAAFLIMQALQRLLAGTELAKAQAGTLRCKLLKVGARVRQTLRRIRVELPSSYPYQPIWQALLGNGL
jgi:hypothetical protein